MRQPFRILFVCTGNMCRSPLAERLARARLAASGVVGVEVESAGTHGVSGAPVHPDTAEVLMRLGGDPAGFVARRLTKEMADVADLVLTATREHRDFVSATCLEAAGRVFTILEFCALAGAVSPASLAPAREAGDRARALMAAVAPLRHGTDAEPAGALDIADPVGRPMAAQEAAAAVIARALDCPLSLIAGQPQGSTRRGGSL
ncbi:MAG: hypothetical protein ACM3ML_22280 [Micromonosporaceae bacterium]